MLIEAIETLVGTVEVYSGELQFQGDDGGAYRAHETHMVFDALIDKEVINPVFLVDELDKAATDAPYDPIAPLYQLLKQRTAAVFRDESIPELAIDTSHINWILAANDIDRIPAPIRSRLHVIDVPPPTPAQTRIIVREPSKHWDDDHRSSNIRIFTTSHRLKSILFICCRSN